MVEFLETIGNFRIGGLPWLWWFVPISALIALGAAYSFYRSVMEKEEGTALMIEIGQAVKEGATAYLKRQYRVIAIVFGVLFIVFSVMAYFRLVSPITPVAFILGGFFSALSGFIGMKTATSAGSRTAHAARTSLNNGLQVAFRGGAVMGFSVVGFTLLTISVIFLALYFAVPQVLYRGEHPLREIATIMVSGVFGASAVALFARVGGGIYTKAADVGADLVGKVEAGIPEDDPRNPAVIADNVGDCVGDVAGLGADLYESYMGSILATVVLGVSAISFQNGAIERQMGYLSMPLVLAAAGVIMSIIGVLSVRIRGKDDLSSVTKALQRGIRTSAIGIALVSLPLVLALQLDRPLAMWGVIVTGLLVGIVIGRATDYFTSSDYSPPKASQLRVSAGQLPC
jgi:K(+)-stimulated pyrophosphate-energized sodium pump